MVNTPVLFETFVRVDYARQVWEAIKAAQPKILYFYSNKGRLDKPGEIENNNEIRSWVNEIDWDCELHTWFRDECVDVYTSLRGAIDWLFDNEETGIILEDDCVPVSSFWPFCEHFLEKYKDDNRIGFISGDNYASEYVVTSDHIISRVFYMYGWATWRDRWIMNRQRITERNFLKNRYIDEYYSGLITKCFWKSFYKDLDCFVEKTYCWDYVFSMNCIKNKQYGVCPHSNLVLNIGEYGEHSNGDNAPTRCTNVINQDYRFIESDKFHIDDKYELIVLNSFFGSQLNWLYLFRRTMSRCTPEILKKIYKKIKRSICSI